MKSNTISSVHVITFDEGACRFAASKSLCARGPKGEQFLFGVNLFCFLFSVLFVWNLV